MNLELLALGLTRSASMALKPGERKLIMMLRKSSPVRLRRFQAKWNYPLMRTALFFLRYFSMVLRPPTELGILTALGFDNL
jgi:hypothetical protein